jgi:hypothetical protein
MPFTWKRSESVDFPKTYLNFQALDLESENQVQYFVEDLQQCRFKDVISIMSDQHLKDEPMYSSKGVLDCPQSLQEMIGNWENMLQQGISLVCYKEGSDEIIAVNVLGVVSEIEFDSPHNVSFNKQFKQLFILNNFLS